MKQAILITALIIALYLIFRKKVNAKIKEGIALFTENHARTAILAVKQKYGETMARTVEKMFRLETSHFRSEQYRKTGTAGMEAGKWKDLPKNLPVIKMHDSDKTDGIDTFIVWNPTDFALYLAAYITRHGGNFARWYSLNSDAQKTYAQKVSAVKTKFV